MKACDRALREGAQIYWVCPAVDSETARDMTAAEERAAHLRQIFGERVGLVHGRLSGAEKDAAIAAFAARDTSILVATTVIEVGVNVPAATVMIIENAEMFGLAQLHQLRGRVGRGAAQSSCVLLYKAPLSDTAKSRLDILRQVEDGFVIAEEDLRLRGGGEVLGRARAATRASASRNGRRPRRSWTARPTSPDTCFSAIPISNRSRALPPGAASPFSSATTPCGCCRRDDGDCRW